MHGVLVACSDRVQFVVVVCVCLYSGARQDGSEGGDSEVQRTMLELLNQLDGFEPTQNIKVHNSSIILQMHVQQSSDGLICCVLVRCRP
jgi:hypothetical protein